MRCIIMPLLPLLLALTLFRQVIYLKILRQGSQQPDLAASITLEPSLKPNLRLRSINATCCSSVYPVNIPLEGSDYAASRHIIVDGINQSKILNWADSPNDACLLADIRVKVKKPKREGDACRDVSNKIIQAHNHSGQKLFLLSYFDEPEFTCDPFCGESVDRTDVQYGKRSMTVGRGGFRPGKPANYSAYEAHSRGPVSWLPYSVRTDQVLEMMRLTKYEYNATSAGTFEVREGKLPYLPRLPRKVDARVFRDYLAGRGPKSKTMRNRMAGKVLEIARTHPSLNITVGMVGSKGVKGRTTIHPEYVTGLLSAKVVVLCQPDEYEGHFRFFEAMAAGALVMTDPSIHLPSGYVDGVNVVVYSLSDLERKLLYYIENEETRIEIASKGWELAMTRHRSWNRMEDFILDGCDDDDNRV